MAKLAIIGNGPSRTLFDGSFDGPAMHCNIPMLDYKGAGVCVIDEKSFLWYKHNGYKPDVPIYTNNKLAQRFRDTGCEPVIDLFNKQKLMNVAQTAAWHFAEEFDEIYLYGCDALWQKDCGSFCDEHIPRPARNPNLYNRWRKQWEPVWQQPCTFYIVQPFFEETVDYGKNVYWQQSVVPRDKEIPTRNIGQTQ